MAHIIIGTAGHIDHGKTALVRALTGTDTDRLKEEKERGLTIDLGFAHFGDTATIIDVPGHEKFIRNMVAGVSTIDLVLLVVAADDGVMPQTREHLDILNILQVKHGIIVITKTDLVEEEWLQLIKDDIRSLVKDTFLGKAEIVAVSSVTQTGIVELKTMILAWAGEADGRQDKGVFWMPVDRAFTMKGFGTVVTGSVLSGTINVGEGVELLPSRHKTKIRGLQSQGKNVERVSTGDRAALNLQGIEKQGVGRGDVAAKPGSFGAASRFDARLRMLASAPRALEPRARVRLHFGTTEVMARVSIVKQKKIEPGQTGYVQLNLETPASARRLDPFVIRQYSPTLTIGGGVVLNADAPRRKLSEPQTLAELQALEREDPSEVLESILLAAGARLLTFEQLASEMAVSQARIQELAEELQREEKIVFLKKAGKAAATHIVTVGKMEQACLDALATFHKNHPMKPGLHKAELKGMAGKRAEPQLLEFAVARLTQNGNISETTGMVKLAGHKITLSPEQAAVKSRLSKMLLDSRFSPPSESALASELDIDGSQLRNLMATMVALGEAVRVDEGIFFHQSVAEEARTRLIDSLKANSEITISQFKELLGGVSRKYAMPLINHFDRIGVTRREGDVRVLGDGAQGVEK